VMKDKVVAVMVTRALKNFSYVHSYSSTHTVSEGLKV